MTITSLDRRHSSPLGQALRAGQPYHVNLRTCVDLPVARATVRKLAGAVGYSLADQARLATAVFEIARLIVQTAGRGQIVVSWREDDPQHQGLEFLCKDYGLSPLAAAPLSINGPGAAAYGPFPAVRKLVDEFNVLQDAQGNNHIIIIKWIT